MYIFLVFLFFLLVGCFNESSVETNTEESLERGYWLDAGLIPGEGRGKWGLGLYNVKRMGNRLFVSNSRVESLNPNMYNVQIFTALQGSSAWDTLKPPEQVKAFNIYVDSLGLFVGTHKTGEVWQYKPNTKEWINLNAPKLDSNTYLNVYGLTRYQGKLIIAFSGKTAEQTISPILEQQQDGSWTNISPPYDPQPFDKANMDKPFYFTEALEWRGKLFAITVSYGVWMYDGVAWSHIPNPPEPIWWLNSIYFIDYGGVRKPRSMVIHKDRLYVGQYAKGGVHALQDNFQEWVAIDSVQHYNVGTDSGYTVSNPQANIYAMASDGKDLFVAGADPGIPMVYMGDDRGEPKGWRVIDRVGWCPKGKFACLGIDVNDMVVLGDTLYAAAWEGLFKFPLAKLDSVLSREKSYRGLTKDW
ncbi:hypothetical protein AGMMS49938_07760 [Fibrobacterales bacterium]|nr:hypothetical protein AGMMS49938_07760 [Fibrobacterales bacterium]